MAQIRQVVSETLQATVRRLLPSQQGFTEDLQASNVITPIIDLTPSAEGSTLPVDLSRALAFGSQTAFQISNTTTVIANTTGFYRIIGTATIKTGGNTSCFCLFDMSDGLTTKTVWGLQAQATSDTGEYVAEYDFIVFLAAGESISGRCANATSRLNGSSRQVADVNGELVNPSGFVQQ